jgi:uncharacterized protein (UPF0261 family)
MAKTIVIVGTLDTKGHEFGYVKDLIEQYGLNTLVVDFGVLEEPVFKPDIDRYQVVKAGGGDLETLISGDHKDIAMKTMADGLSLVVRQLYDDGMLDGILGMGGGGGTSIATAAMRCLPYGIPKMMLSTMAGGDVSEYVGIKDITLMPSVVDVAGFNPISRQIYTNAAGAIVGMVQMESPSSQDDKPLIAASMFGNTTKCVDRAREHIENQGYDVLVFHATGTGGKTMESIISEGFIKGSLDITTTELADEVCGGVLSAGPERCMAASRAGIPAVIVPGCVDMANFFSLDSVPEKYQERNLYKWNPNITLLRTNIEENKQIGRLIADAANASDAPVAIFLPLHGVSMLDSPGGDFWDPEADNACFEAIKQNLKPGIPVVELENNINDIEFSDNVSDTLLDMLNKQEVNNGY